MTSSHVLRFDDEASGTHDLVGGKGANLGRLTHAGFPVPPGFTVTTAGHAAFLAGDGLAAEIDALAAGLDHEHADELERGTAAIRELIVGRELPEAIAGPVREAYATLGDGTYVAVRSSGTAEDLAEASFAGMHDTYLDIVGADGVLDAIKRCWASLWTARAASYRHTKGFDHRGGIAVVVQTMVPSEVSGVMFTANPLTAATDEIVIDASWGLGEAIVSGIATPDEYTVAHRDLRVKAKTLGAKEKRVVRNPETGVGTVAEDVPPQDRDRFSLTDEQAAQLADLGRRVQAHYSDFPQDTEWGYAEGEFYLLQSRPVTGVDLSWDADVDGWQWNEAAPDETVWTRAWADEIWTGAITPLMYSFRARSFTHSSQWAQGFYQNPEGAQMRMWKYYRGNAYYNTTLEQSFITHTSLPSTRAALLANLPATMHQETLDAPFSMSSFLKLHVRCQVTDPLSGFSSWVKAHNKYLVDGIAKAQGLGDEELTKLSDAELIRYIEEMWKYETDYIQEVWTGFFIHARDAFSGLVAMLTKWYDGGRATVFTDLITGVPRPTAAMIEANALWRLAQGIRNSEVLSKAFAENREGAFFEAAGDSEEGRAWLKEYDAFMAENGHRGHADRDIYYLRRAEHPGVDYRALEAFLAADGDADPEAKEKEVEAKRQTVIAEVADNIRRKPFGAVKAELFKAMVEYITGFLLFRDDERHWVDRTTFSIKRGYTELSRRLRERGVLEGERDYFFLTGQELYAMLLGNANLPLTKAKLAARMRNFDRVDTGAGTNPKYLVGTRDADLEYERVPGQDLPEGMFLGIGTSGGMVEGTARVVKELKDIGRVQNGEILVTNSTDPGWTPVFLLINAIVLETGGLLAHGSCLAREYGMPAVQLAKAMQLIPDGARIRIDGDKGTVEILEAAAEPTPELVEA
ncbi:MAG TPA: PEP/pyruvate-binding domain-containing protein [Solirubrobacteraceae bacterium]|nr:PEP/pyruvate-binding domain-containing protein [Solirubrobacteraceae bacterium]